MVLFSPGERSGFLRDRCVIFSGGKLEYRKGQDIVVAAFRIFRQRHPEALLMVAWHNYWAEKMGNVVGLPRLSGRGYLDVGEWLCANGLPEDSFLEIGVIPNPFMPNFLREADVALFSNRCEGGTNLVAMECFACGVPTILSSYDGWGEPDLEEVYIHRDRARHKAEAARRFIQDWTWENQTRCLLEAVDFLF